MTFSHLFPACLFFIIQISILFGTVEKSILKQGWLTFSKCSDVKQAKLNNFLSWVDRSRYIRVFVAKIFGEETYMGDQTKEYSAWPAEYLYTFSFFLFEKYLFL